MKDHDVFNDFHIECLCLYHHRLTRSPLDHKWYRQGHSVNKTVAT